MIRILAAAALAAGLAGCTLTAPRPSVPASPLTCADAPEWKRGCIQRDAAGHVVDLRDAHADCRDRLGTVRDIVGGNP